MKRLTIGLSLLFFNLLFLTLSSGFLNAQEGSIVNGNFETGDFTGWQTTKSGMPGCGGSGLDTVVVGANNHKARIGDPDYIQGEIPVGYGSISQTIVVENRYLKFRYRVNSKDIFYNPENEKYWDTFEVSVNSPLEEVGRSQRDQACQNNLNPDNQTIEAQEGLVVCAGRVSVDDPEDLGWREVTLDLNSFLNQDITLYFSSWNRGHFNPYCDDKGWWNTWVLIDDVEWVSSDEPEYLSCYDGFDDEFESSSLDDKWATFLGQGASATTENGRLKIFTPSTGQQEYNTVRSDILTGDFEVEVDLDELQTGNYGSAELAFINDVGYQARVSLYHKPDQRYLESQIIKNNGDPESQVVSLSQSTESVKVKIARQGDTIRTFYKLPGNTTYTQILQEDQAYDGFGLFELYSITFPPDHPETIAYFDNFSVSCPGAQNLTFFKLHPQGIFQQGPDKTAQVKLVQDGEVKHEFDSASFQSDDQGFYQLTLSEVNPGTYDVYVKGWAHLTKKFSNIEILQGENSIDLSSEPLLAGDAVANDYVNIQDFNILAQDYLGSGVESTADFNLDGVVNIQDFNLLAQNYLERGQQP